MAEITSVPVASGRLRLKLPLASVVVPLVVPCTSTVTPGSASPADPSTRPCTVTGAGAGAIAVSRPAIAATAPPAIDCRDEPVFLGSEMTYTFRVVCSTRRPLTATA